MGAQLGGEPDSQRTLTPEAPGGVPLNWRGPAESWHVAAALVGATSPMAQLQLLLEAAPRVANADTASIYLRDPDSGRPQLIAHHGFRAPRIGGARREGMTERVLHAAQLVVIDDTLDDPRVNPVVRRAGIRSLVAIPLMARVVPDVRVIADPPSAALSVSTPGELRAIGVLYVNARHPRAFTPEKVESLKGLAALAAVAIENGYLLQTHRAAVEHLADALRLREQFASAAAHELKTPLTPLKGYAQAIRRRLERDGAAGAALDAAWLARSLSIMLGQIDRLDRLVSDLLDVSRLRTGQFSIEPEVTDLVGIVRDTFERFRDVVMAQEEVLEANLEHCLHLECRAESLPGDWDRVRLDQLITNLLGNAVKYSPSGGRIELVVERAEASNSGFRQHVPEVGPEWVHLAVRDQGIGLPPDQASRLALFEPFSRGENAPADRFSGFGLGLYICAEVASRHGGAIWAESAGPDGGAVFHVLLPPHPPAPTTDARDTRDASATPASADAS